MTISGVKVEGKEIPAATITYEMPKAESLYDVKLTIKDEKTVVKADGKDQALVTFELRDNQGQVITDAGKVEVAFTATFGNFGEKRVTVQNGIAQALFTSESLQDAKTALITATVVEAENKNLVNLKAERNILLDPNPNTGDVEEKVGATLTDVAASQADRVIVYFNKEVDVHNYTLKQKDPKTGKMVDTFKVDPNKLDLNVWTEVPNNEAHTAAAPKNAKAVTVKGILPVEGNKKALTVMLDAEATTAAVLTDNSNFKVQTVDKTGTLDVEGFKSTTLTDARVPAMLDVQRTDLKEIKVLLSEAINSDSAKDPKNWVLDGLRLDNKAWGDATKTAATATVGEFDPVTGTDNRHIVTIKLGQDAEGDQIFFKPGDHSIQGSNIGDWANLTDEGNNVLNTQTLDFNVPADDTIPTAAVTVQSPEQYIVNFNKELTKYEDVATKLVLQKRQIQADGTITWVEPKAKDVQTIKVTNIQDVKGATTEYKVEVEKDWTKIYETSKSNLNYYNDVYRLHLPKDTVKAAANGKGNEEINLVLGGAMLTPDVQSPEIKAYDHVNEIVTMSEPVKLPVSGDELPTLAEGLTSIPQPTADFIGKDEKGNYVTIPAKAIDSTFVDNYDMKFTVAPSKKLTPGEWTLVVRSISDDVGNTAASTEFKFTVDKVEKPEFAKDFRVVWAYADTKYEDGNDATTGLPTQGEEQDPDTKDAVYVKFNKPVKITGKADNALATANYTLNGQALPKGTQIVGNIVGYDDKDQIIDSVTIVLPNGTITNAETTVLTISEHLTTDKGEKLTNGGQFKLSHNIHVEASKKELKAGATAEENLKALEAALADDSLRSITLPPSFNLPTDTVIEVNRLVDLDLGGNTNTYKALTVNTTEGGKMTVKNGTLTDLTVNTPNADFKAGTGLNVTGTTIKDVLSSTFTNEGTLKDVVITDTNGTSFVNEGTVTGTVTVDTTGEVTLGGTTAYKVEATKAADITVTATGKLTITAKAKDVKVTTADGATAPTLQVDGGTIVDADGKEVEDVTVTGDQAQEAVKAEALKITTAPAIADGKLALPTVAEGYTVAMKSSSNTTVISLEGAVTPQDAAETTVDVVYTVTSADGKYSADTVAIKVTVPAKEVEEADTYAITFVAAEGKETLENATIKVYSDAEKKTEVTDFSKVEAGTYYYTITKTGFNEVTGNVVVTDAAQEVKITLEETL